jgi:tyrosine-protein phosphatase SIW14
MKPNLPVVLSFLLLGILVPAGADTIQPNTGREWATPMGVCEPQRFFKVSDELYRGGHLSRAGVENLRCAGINTVVSLRFVSRDSRYITAAGLNYFHIPGKVWAPNDDDAVEFLRIATNPSCQPVYVYCNRGADRTGMMCAVYRVVIQGWSKEEAICEMTEGPFDYHPIWKRVVQYVRDMDVDALRCRLASGQ